MKRVAQALGVVVAIFTSAAIGFFTGVILMARQEILPTAEPTPPPRWERSV